MVKFLGRLCCTTKVSAIKECNKEIKYLIVGEVWRLIKLCQYFPTLKQTRNTIETSMKLINY
jgi:hypothetical protein